MQYVVVVRNENYLMEIKWVDMPRLTTMLAPNGAEPEEDNHDYELISAFTFRIKFEILRDLFICFFFWDFFLSKFQF